MKSLKSRLRRQDAPGPTSSGAAAAAGAAASGVSPGLSALPCRGVFLCSEARAPSLTFPQRAGLGGRGDSSSLRPGLRVGMETLGTLPSATPGPHGTPATPLSSGSPRSWLGD